MTRVGLDYPTDWGRGYLACAVRNIYQEHILAPFMKRMSSLEVHGLENIAGDGPFIFVANHTSHLDTPLILTALPIKIRRRVIVAAAMDNFFMKPAKAFRTVLAYNAIPIDRHKLNRRSSQLALELVEDGWHLLLYPEGGRSPDGNLQEFKGGAAYLADRAHATVIPTYIHEAGLLRGKKYAKAPIFTKSATSRHHVSVHFGLPVATLPDDNVRRFGARIEESVAALGRSVSGNDAYGRRPIDEY